MVSIHERRPRGYWIRVWIRRSKWDVAKPRELHERTSLCTARAIVPKGFVRSENEDGDALEVWTREAAA